MGFAGLHKVSMNAVFPCALGTWIPESKVPSFSHAFFFSLSHLKLDALQGQGCEAMAHIFILPAPLLLLSSGSTLTSFPCMLKLQELEGNCCVLTALSNENSWKKNPRLFFFLFQMCFLPSSVVFADLSPFMWLATKLVDKLTFQGSWFAEIAEPAKCLSPAALSMTRLFSDLGEKAGRCLWQVSFLPQTKTGNYCVV